jgi:hypothetical protein
MEPEGPGLRKDQQCSLADGTIENRTQERANGKYENLVSPVFSAYSPKSNSGRQRANLSVSVKPEAF